MAQSHTQSRREREREQRRAAILKAARQVFFAKGIYQTTMDDVAVAAEVSKGTIYLYLKNKETVLVVLLQEGLALLHEQLENAFSANEDLPAPTRLRRMAGAYFQFFQTYPFYYRLLTMFERRKFQESVEPELYEQTLIRSTRGLTFVVKALEQGIRENCFHIDDPKKAASVLWAMLHGVYVILGNPLRKEMLASDLESLYNSAVELALKGLMSN